MVLLAESRCVACGLHHIEHREYDFRSGAVFTRVGSGDACSAEVSGGHAEITNSGAEIHEAVPWLPSGSSVELVWPSINSLHDHFAVAVFHGAFMRCLRMRLHRGSSADRAISGTDTISQSR